MENASKALIIAGAILISILLISVGIIIMNAINDPVQQGAESASSQAVQIFNAQFTGYAGTGVDYNTAKQCITTVKSNAGTHTIKLTGIETYTALDRNKTYTIDFGYDNEGYINTCNIAATTTNP